MAPPSSSTFRFPTMIAPLGPLRRASTLTVRLDGLEPGEVETLPSGLRALVGAGGASRGPTSILTRSAAEIRGADVAATSATPTETATIDAARAFFDRPVPESPDLEYLETAWRHYQTGRAAYAEMTPVESLLLAHEVEGWLEPIRSARARFGDAAESCPLLTARRRGLALTAEIDAALVEADGLLHPNRPVDEWRLRNELREWTRSLREHPAEAAAAVEAYGRIAVLAHRHHLNDVLRGEIRDGIQELYAGLMHPPAGTSAEQQVQNHLLALQLATAALGALGAEARNDLLDARNAVLSDADRLEAELSRAVSAPARLQILGTLASLYRPLRRDAEGGTDPFLVERYDRTLEAIRTNARDAAISPALRARLVYETAIQIGADGDEARCVRWILELRGEAEDLLRRAEVTRGLPQRLELLQQVLAVRAVVGDSAEREAVRGLIRPVLALIESRAERGSSAEDLRQVQTFLAEAYAGMEDWDAAMRLLDAIRHGLPTAETRCTEGTPAETMSVEDHALWLLRLGDVYQRIANARVAGTDASPELSRFDDTLADLSALGAQHGRPTMVLYSRFLRALVANDPAASELYRQLQDWRPESASNPATTPAIGMEVTEIDPRLSAWSAALAGTTLGASPYEPDVFQNLGARVYEGPRRMEVLSRSSQTIQWLSMLIEGNYAQRIHAAADEGADVTALRRERDEMRDALTRVQSLLASGRVANTHDAIEGLAALTGNSEAARDFYHRIGLIFEHEDLDGSRISDSSAIADLIRSETIADPNVQAVSRLSIVRIFIREDSLNHRCGAVINSLFNAIRDSHQPGYAPPPALTSLEHLMRGSNNLDDLANLYNRLAGNNTLAAQVESSRGSRAAWQTTNEVLDHLFSVEGGVIVLTSLFTAGLTAELAAAGMAAELGATALTWGGRAAIGLSRFGTMYATLNVMQLGLTSGYRALEGRPAVTEEQIRNQLIGSAFSLGVGEVFSGASGLVLGRMFGATSAATGMGRFMAFNAGMLAGEDLSAAAAGTPRPTGSFGLRYFRATLDGAFLAGGAHLAHGLIPLTPREGLRTAVEPEIRVRVEPARSRWGERLDVWRDAFRRHGLGMAFLFTGSGGLALGPLPARARRAAETATPAWRGDPDLIDVITSTCRNQNIPEVVWPAEGAPAETPLSFGPAAGLPEARVGEVATVLSEAMELTGTPITRVRVRLGQVSNRATLETLLSLASAHGTEFEVVVGGETLRLSADRPTGTVRVSGVSPARATELGLAGLRGTRIEIRLSGDNAAAQAEQALALAAAAGERILVVENAQGQPILESTTGMLRVHADRVPAETLRRILADNPGTGRPVRILIGGVERVILMPGSDGRARVNVELRGADAETAAASLNILGDLPADALRNGFIQVQNLAPGAATAPAVRTALAHLTRRALAEGIESLAVQSGTGTAARNLIRLRRNQPVVRLAYAFESAAPVSEIHQVVAEYLAFESSELHPELRSLHRGAAAGEASPLVRLWLSALDHAEAFSRRGRERETYQRYWSDPNSLTPWLQGLQTLASYARSTSANAARVRQVFDNLLNFSQPAEGRGLLGYAPFDGRALGDNAFELLRIAEQDQGTLTLSLDLIATLMGRTDNVELGGAFVGLVYKAVVRQDGAARHEVEALRDQIREAARLRGERFRLTVLPEDRETRVTTPEWVLERLDAEGRALQLIAAEVKARNMAERGETELRNALVTATAQLTNHPFTNGVAAPEAMLILRLSQVRDRAATSRLVQRLLGEEYGRLYGSSESGSRTAALRMRDMTVRVYFETGEAGASTSVLLSFNGSAWVPATARSSALETALAAGAR